MSQVCGTWFPLSPCGGGGGEGGGEARVGGVRVNSQAGLFRCLVGDFIDAQPVALPWEGLASVTGPCSFPGCGGVCQGQCRLPC